MESRICHIGLKLLRLARKEIKAVRLLRKLARHKLAVAVFRKLSAKLLRKPVRLLMDRKQKFISFFERSTSRSEMVATFMAMLALVKSKKVEINGDGNDAEVTLITNRR